jgi:hypothetical protein
MISRQPTETGLGLLAAHEVFQRAQDGGAASTGVGDPVECTAMPNE